MATRRAITTARKTCAVIASRFAQILAKPLAGARPPKPVVVSAE
jgi:hypothetical protein